MVGFGIWFVVKPIGFAAGWMWIMREGNESKLL